MIFSLGNGVWNSIFAVPSDIVDKHIRLCGPLSLKALMVILRNGGNVDTAQIAKLLGQSEADVKDAVNYWIESGIIQSGGDTPRAEEQEKKAIPNKAAEAVTSTENHSEERQVVSLTNARPKLTTQQINELADNDGSISHLLREAQHITGKPLTPVASETVAALYAYYGMRPDIILMLIQYCVSIGKKNMHYIEKVAASWLEKGVDSHERAETEIRRLTELHTAEGKIRSIFGIYDRALIPNEQKYIETWIGEWQMDFSLIKLAYERAIELTGKLSFAYINGILSKWRQKGIATPEQAAGEMTPGKQYRKSNPAAKEASYDMSELESMLNGEMTRSLEAVK